MRKYHRWISVFFGVFLLWIAVTGVLSQVGELVNSAGGAGEHEQRTAPAVPAGFVCPETMTCRPKPVRAAGSWNVGMLHHLHSGESFGPVGTWISILSGFAMIFFSFSGLWMYIQMWRNRARRDLSPKWFWK